MILVTDRDKLNRIDAMRNVIKQNDGGRFSGMQAYFISHRQPYATSYLSL